MALIACVGDCDVDRYTDRNVDRPGGCTLNVAANMARLAPGLDVHLVSALGDDPAGDQVAAAIAGLPLTSHVARVKGATAVQQLTIDASGERQFEGYDVGVLGNFRLTPTQKRVVATGDWVVGVVYKQLLPFFRRLMALPRRGRLAVDFMDLSDFGTSLGSIEEFLPPVDVAFFGLNAGDEPLIDMLRGRARHSGRTYVVTLGKDGSLCFVGAAEYRAIAVPVDGVVDTTGAGDAFAAAFLARFLTGAPVADALAAASKHAATVITQLGAF